MTRLISLILISSLWIGCQPTQKEDNKVSLVTDYINALNEANYSKINNFFLDSIRLKEIDYLSIYSKEEYREVFRWDSTFRPQYKILSIEEDGGIVKMQVSKMGKRIQFLHEEPTITEEVVHFQQGKITSIDIVRYIVFDDEKWSKNRAKLIQWIDKHHPELNGFLYDQSKEGAINYLRAINLFTSKNE